jgi:glycosyltransferase involved in cell wall biosynthesis/peptidoglycan/xylan/chitin deacetylase (PgdA/CDA1 family)/SAM-dependent methyltransferase
VATPRISVLIPCFNQGAFVVEAVESVQAQTRQDFEVIVVNDGSTDAGTNRVLEALRARRTAVVRTENQGLAKARNAALARARGEYVCFLDADDALEPTFLERTAALLEADPRLTFASTWLRNFGTDTSLWTPERCDLTTLLAEDTVLTAALVRRQAVVDVGGFDATMPAMGYEDWALWLTLVERGARGAIVREPLFRYRRRHGSMHETCTSAEVHQKLFEHLLKTHRESYRRQVIDVLSHRDAEGAQWRAESRRLERELDEVLSPQLAGRRAELERLKGKLEGRGAVWATTPGKPVAPAGTSRPTSAISVVVVFPHGNSGQLGATLQSIHAQTSPAGEIRVIDAAGSPGFGSGANLGVRTTTGAEVMVLCAGDTLAPDALERCARHLNHAPELAFVTTAVAERGGPAPRHTTLAASLAGVGPHRASVFRRSTYDAVGGFDETLAAHEATAFFCAALEAGLLGGWLDLPLVRLGRGDAANEASAAAAMGTLYARHHASLDALAADVLATRERVHLALRDSTEALRNQRTEVLAQLETLRVEIDAAQTQLARRGLAPLDWNDLRRTTPLSPFWGVERGGPVDRVYIERFLAAHRADIRGRVLEVKDDGYARALGSSLEAVDILDVDPTNARATVVADLSRAEQMPVGRYDCIVLTQTLHIIYELKSAIANAVRALKPGGVLLCTVPVVSRVNPEDGGLEGGDAWRLTPFALRKTFIDLDPVPDEIAVEGHGNVLTSTAFLYGLGATELSREELDHDDPFFPTILTARVRASQRAAKPRPGLVLAWHRVADVSSDAFSLSVTPRHFRAQLGVLARRCGVLSLEALLEGAARGELGDRAVALTFDDGTVDALTTVSPLLLASGFPAIFFVTSKGLDATCEHWWDALEHLLEKTTSATLNWHRLAQPRQLDTLEARADAARAVAEFLRPLDAASRASAWRELEAALGPTPAARESHRALTANELRRLSARAGHAIGSHTEGHLWAPRQPEAALREELQRSRDRLTELTGRAVSALAWPFGAHSGEALRVARELYRHAVVTGGGVVGPSIEPLAVPRLVVPDVDGPAFEALLDETFAKAQ